MEKFKKIVVLIICLGLVFGLALCFAACNNGSITNSTDNASSDNGSGDNDNTGDDNADSENKGLWNSYNGLSFGYINVKDCQDGNIDEEKVKSEMRLDLDNTYYMVIDFTMQAVRDNGGTDRLYTKLEIEPSSAIEATTQDAATSEIREDVIGGIINIELSYKIPESAKTKKQMRLIIQLRPRLSSDIAIRLSFDSDNNLNAVKTTSVDDLLLGNYTQGLKFTATEDGGYAVSKGNADNEKQIVIPILKDGRYVTTMGNAAFRDCSSLTNITIPDSITNFGNDVFTNCSSLQYNENDNGLYLGNYNNPYLVFVKAKDKTITSIKLGDNTRFIHSEAFNGCSSLTSIKIPYSVTFIGNYAFSNCSSLVYNEYSNGLYLGNALNPYMVLVKTKDKTIDSFKINSNTKFIHSDALNGCSSLTNIIVPNSVTSIGLSAFKGCSSLTSITSPFVGAGVGSSNAHFGYIFGAVTYLVNDNFVPDSLKEVIITGSSTIGDNAFQYCGSLTNIVIPDVTAIGEYAFSNCGSLKYNEYDNGLYIGNKDNPYLVLVRAKDKDITSVDINPNTKFIHTNAFEDCNDLKSITIPNSVTSIGYLAFYGCSSLTSITLPFIGNCLSGASNTHFGYIFGAYIYVFNNSYVPDSLKEVIITGSSSIGENAFNECNTITSVTIGNSVTSIGESAFFDCSSLASVTIGNSVTSIGESAFFDCNSLTSVTIGNSVTSIGSGAFLSCERLVEIYNLSSLIITKSSLDYGYIGYHALDIYTDLSQPSKLITDINGYVFHIDGNNKTLVAYLGKSTELVIPNSVTVIGKYAFSDFGSLKKITIPNSVTTIDEWAFEDCDLLREITIPNGVTSIGGFAFNNCRSLISITVPNSVTSIGNAAFLGCDRLVEVYNLSSLNITKGSSDNGNVGMYALDIYTDLSEPSKISTVNDSIIHINGSEKTLVAYIGSSTEITISDGVTNIGDYAFYKYRLLTSITIPSSVEGIGNSAFSGCDSLASITIPDGVINIGNSAFSECDVLTNITLPSSVKSIGNSAFKFCKSLTSITIPEGITSIGDDTFCSCDSLTSISLPSSIKSIGNSAFMFCNSLTSITMPDGVTSIGDNAFYYCNSLTNIIIPDSITSIGDNAFGGCSFLKYNENNNGLYLGNDNNPYLVLVKVKDKTIKSFEVNGKTKFIHSQAFNGCSSLINIILPNSVIDIGDNVFYGCNHMQSINYEGTKSEWNEISKDKGWKGLSKITVVHCTDGDVEV